MHAHTQRSTCPVPISRFKNLSKKPANQKKTKKNVYDQKKTDTDVRLKTALCVVLPWLGIQPPHARSAYGLVKDRDKIGYNSNRSDIPVLSALRWMSLDGTVFVGGANGVDALPDIVRDIYSSTKQIPISIFVDVSFIRVKVGIGRGEIWVGG